MHTPAFVSDVAPVALGCTKLLHELIEYSSNVTFVSAPRQSVFVLENVLCTILPITVLHSHTHTKKKRLESFFNILQLFVYVCGTCSVRLSRVST